MPLNSKSKRVRSVSHRSLFDRSNLHLWQLEDRHVPAGTITGTIFVDFNANGVFDNTNPTIPNLGSGGTQTVGVARDVAYGAGIQVTAYDSANNQVGSATSQANGTFTLPVSGTGRYRLQFSGLPANVGTFYGPAGTSNGTTIRFVDDPNGGTTAGLNLGIVSNNTYAQSNPLLITSRYVFGAINSLNANVPTVQSFPYSSGRNIVDGVIGDGGASIPDYQNPTTHAINIPFSQVGATWGLAEDENTARLFMAAFMKRHTDFGPSGTGAIYTTNIPPQSQQLLDNVVTTASTFINLNTTTDQAGNFGLAGGTSFRATAGHDFLTDGLSGNVGWDSVGKLGLGGLEISPDGRFLYSVGLNTRRLYVVDTQTLQMRSYALPVFTDPTTGITGISVNNPLGDLRPFAVSWHNGSIYVGAVNSAESTYSSNDPANRGDSSRLRAYVFRFNPGANPVASSSGQFVDLAGTATTAPVLNIPLNYARGYTHPGVSPSPSDDLQSEWLPWSPVYRNLNLPRDGAREAVYPQPMLTGLSFDAAGNIVLGLRDRAGDQFGAFTPADPNNPTNPMVGITAGDMLRAFGNTTTGWTLESNGADPRAGSPGGSSATGVGNLQGPGGGEFYNGDYLVPGIFTGIQDHNEIAAGGVLQIPGFPDALSSVFDPAMVSQRYNAGGVRWFSNSGANAGAAVKGYELYQTEIQLPNPPALFAKANGVGDLVAFSNPVVEIGNRIWNDANRNGVQDANEAGIPNLQVLLLNAAGAPIGTTTTDTDGNYYFTNAMAATPAFPGKAYLSSEDASPTNLTGFVAGRQYTVRIPLNTAPNQALLTGLTLTTLNAVIAGVNDPDSIDSDAVLNGNNADIAVAALAINESNHTYDAGFAPPPPSLSIGDFVWNDANNDGQWQTTEQGLAGITVQLVNITAGTTVSQVTNAQGGYLFQNLQPGTYQVQIPFNNGTTQPNLLGYYSSTGAFTTNTGPFEPVVGDPANNFDHGSTNAGLTFVTGPQITLVFGAAPLNETLTANGGDRGISETIPDANSYRNQDFGFWQPVSVGDRVWVDANNNGVRETTEAALQGVTVQLLDNAGTVVATTVTNAEGGYLFTYLSAGQYTVRLVRDAVLTGYVSSTGTIGSTSGPFEPVTADTANDRDHGTDVTGFINGPQVNLTIGGATAVDPATIPAGLPFDPAGATSRYRNQDFGVFQPLALGDFVWIDANNDGVLNTGETPLANVPVELLDAAGTALLDANGKAITTVTNTNGNYLFTNLVPGSYRVRITPPTGFVTSTGSNGSLFGSHEPGKSGNENNEDHGTRDTLVSGRIIASVVTLATPGNTSNPDPLNGIAGRANLRQDFGLFQRVSIGDFVWEDKNNDGKFQATESAISGVTVRLLDGSGNQVLGGANGTTPLTTTTATNGGYIFNELIPGKYQVEVVIPNGYRSSTGTNGALTGPFEPVTGDPSNNLDHGTTQANGLTVRGPVVNALVGLAPLDDTDGPALTDTSANDSSYRNQDFGFYRPVFIGDFVWEDVNNNGVLNTGENPIAKVAVELLDGSGNALLDATGKAITTSTDAAGNYLFNNLIPGDYRVRITPPAGYISSTGKNSFSTGPFEPGVNDFTNNADHGTTDGSKISTAKVTLGIPGDATLNPDSLVSDQPNRGNARQDFGLFRPLAIGDLVFRDVANDGVFNAGTDSPIPGVTVRLLDASNTVISTLTTDANGLYRFNLLSPGQYRVEIVPPTGLNSSTGNGFPASFPGPFEPAPQNTTNSVDKGTFNPTTGTIFTPFLVLGLPGDPANPDENGLANLRQDFGLISPQTPPPPALAAISGHVYVDNNINGIREPGEQPIGGTRVYLNGTSTTGTAVTLTTFTDSNGFYQFTNLPAGTYTIREEQPNGFFYDGLDTPGTVGGTTRGTGGNDILRAITLNAGDSGINYDFGEIQPVDTFGHVWVDTNRNAIREAGEAPIPGVAVTISGTAFAGTSLARPLTAADVPNGLVQATNAVGRYDFTVLPPGQYNLTETQPVDFDDWMEQNGDPYGPAPTITNDQFSGITLNATAPIRGPFNFGEVLSESVSPPATSPQVPTDPTKREFLGSTTETANRAAARRSSATTSTQQTQPSPGINSPVSALNLQPRFSVNTGSPTRPAFVAVGSGTGITPQVRVFDYSTGIEKFRIQPYESSYTGGVRTAVADINNDGIVDVVTATGIGGGPRIRVFSGLDGSALQDFFAYEDSYRGGVSLAVGDVDGDGTADIIAGTDQGGGPRVRVFSGSTGLVLQDFFAFDQAQRGGVRVAAADFNADGRADIVTTTGAGVPTIVRVFDGLSQSVISEYQPYGSFSGGAFVSAGDFNGDGTPDVITGADAGGGPHVQVFSGLSGTSIASFFAMDSAFTGGVRVAAADVNGDGRVEIVTGAGSGGGARVSIYSGAGIDMVDDFFAYDIDHVGGVYVGAGPSAGLKATPASSTPSDTGALGKPGSLPSL